MERKAGMEARRMAFSWRHAVIGTSVTLGLILGVWLDYQLGWSIHFSIDGPASPPFGDRVESFFVLTFPPMFVGYWIARMFVNAIESSE
jgi:hypothetical protein